MAGGSHLQMTDSGTAGLAVERLRSTAGLRVEAQAPLKRFTTLRIGGTGEVFVEAQTEAALGVLLAEVARTGLPLVMLGRGANVLVPDEGLPGVTCRLGGELQGFAVDGVRVRAGGAMAIPRLAQETARLGLRGLEALAGFPSTVGGAVVMNAGCYGTEIRDLLIEVTVLERAGGRRVYPVEELRSGYRTTVLAGSGAVVVSALFELQPGDPPAILERLRELNRQRWTTLPSGVANAGSIFKNPVGDFAGRLVEACGLKGRRMGAAQISERHANVIVNEGGARAEDVLGLMIEARRRVEAEFGVTLEPELVLLGSLAERWRAAVAGNSSAASRTRPRSGEPVGAPLGTGRSRACAASDDEVE